MRKVKAAVIGCGAIASSQHIRAYSLNERVELKYLVDIDRSRAERLAHTYNVPCIETDYRAMLADEEVEVVSVCTPNVLHAPISIACLEAGKHVLCEKPAAMNATEAREMQASADRSGKILNIGVAQRFNAQVNKIKELVESGELGNVYHVYCSFRAHRSIPGLGGAFTTKAKAGGGVLIDWGVHFLDLIFYVLSNPKVLTVTGATYGALAQDLKSYAFLNMWAGPPKYDGIYDVEDFVTGLVRTAGSTINLNGAWAQNIGESAMFVEFLGDKAGVKLEYDGDFKLYSSRNGSLYESRVSTAKNDIFIDEIDDFVKSVLESSKNRANIDNVLVTSDVIDALYRSAELGKEVTL
ncbi:MAG: Gfo/Idh/MocA family oxidoreductase [Paenibacillaceae bacterium]|nr:Gfo/Idh/MocA family oxidoreductase [Paenibacillaceae bacterium]